MSVVAARRPAMRTDERIQLWVSRIMVWILILIVWCVRYAVSRLGEGMHFAPDS